MPHPQPHTPEYEVLAIHYGSLSTTRNHIFVNYSEYGEPDGPAELAYFFWVIRGSHGTLVLDTGYHRDAGARRGRDLFVNPEDAFAQLGIQRDFTGPVVLTHAHYDHIGNTGYFTHAPFSMASEEYNFWSGLGSRQALFRNLIEPAEIAHLTALNSAGRLTLLHEDTEILPGVHIRFAPGHTPGQLMLEVPTANGIVLLTSDAVHIDEELHRDMPFRHMTDLPASFATYDQIRAHEAAGAHVLVGHEPAIPARYPAGPITHSYRITPHNSPASS